MMRTIYLALLLLAAGTTFAQDRDLATLSCSLSRVPHDDTVATARQLDVKFRLPVYQKQRNLAGITLGYRNVGLHQFPAAYTSTLHGLIFQGAWMYKFTSRRSITVFAQTGLFSDMKDISGKDFRYSTGFRYRFRHSDKLSTGWGLAYARQFFGNQLVPFIDVDYRPGDRWTISGQFPIKPKISYHFSSKLSAGLELNGEAASYRLSAAENYNRFIQINQWAALGRVEYNFAKVWQLHLGIGRNFKQSYKLYNDASTTHWTIITVPVGRKPDPVQRIDSKGMNLQFGISFNPYEN